MGIDVVTHVAPSILFILVLLIQTVATFATENRLDFMCCDIEPAKLVGFCSTDCFPLTLTTYSTQYFAFTLIARDKHAQLSNIVYHLYLDKVSLEVLQENYFQFRKHLESGTEVSMESFMSLQKGHSHQASTHVITLCPTFNQAGWRQLQ
ncbi:hypothetical protein EV426DRAFT_204245 [Tirmania nivea]|nr:hypothetical protein EV426DRAFT_204245 [Tirmania nivea]